jgi:uncharacterized membrane protein (DUF2068 family)
VEPEPRRRPSEVGLRLIVAYKAVKAVAELVLAAALVITAASGEIAALRGFAEQLSANVASRWSAMAGRAIVTLVSRRGVHLVELGLVLDGLLSVVEGLALGKGYRWGPWLVVVATATPLPLEVAEIARAPRPSRVALAVVNVAVVVYLARGIARRARRGPGTMAQRPP